MSVIPLRPLSKTYQSKRLRTTYNTCLTLLEALRKRNIPLEIMELINDEVEKFKNFSGTEKEEWRELSKSKARLLKLIEKKLKIVQKILI